MKELIYFLIIFILVYLFYFIFVLHRPTVLKKFIIGKEASYLKYKYKIKIKEDNVKWIANTVFLANAFILSTTVFIVCLFENLLLQILLGIATLFILIIFMYHLIGIYYKNKQGGKKNV